MRIIYTDIEVGPTKLITGKSTLALTRYNRNMNICLMLVDSKTQEPNMKATLNWVNVLQDDHAWIKNHSENEGVLEALIDAYQVRLLTSAVFQQYDDGYDDPRDFSVYFVKFRGLLQHKAMYSDFKEVA